MDFGKRCNPPCSDCDTDGHCTMNCGPAIRDSTNQHPTVAETELRAAVLTYLSEHDNPVSDYSHRRTLRNHLRTLVGAPAEPKPRVRK